MVCTLPHCSTRWLVVALTWLCFSAAAAPGLCQESASKQKDQAAAQEASSEPQTDESEQSKIPDEPESDAVEGQESPATDDENGDDPAAEEQDGQQEEETKITISGVFTAQTQATIALNTNQWSSFKVVEFLDHGAEVRKGDTMIRFDTTDLEQAIADLEAEIESDRIKLDLAERQFELLKKNTPTRMATLERDERIATENLKQFLTVKRNSMRESADRSVKTAEDRLTYEEEELEQLEKMYNADDLTEETEEIILLRTRNSVDSARFYLERAKESHEDSIKYEMPRREELLENAMLQATIALEEGQLSLPVRIETEKLQLAKTRLGHERLHEKREKLQSDLELMDVKAPISGTVYYGRPTHGKWPDPTGLNSVFRPGGTAKRNQTLMTVVKTEPLEITAVLKEDQLQDLLVGTTGKVLATADPKAEFSATVASVSQVPSGDKFPAKLQIDELPANLRLVPGMTCKVEFPKASAEDPETDNSEKGGSQKDGLKQGNSEQRNMEKGNANGP